MHVAQLVARFGMASPQSKLHCEPKRYHPELSASRMGAAGLTILHAGRSRSDGSYTGAMLTPAIIAALEAIGIKSPATSKWHRLTDCHDEVIFESSHMCWCGGEPKTVNANGYSDSKETKKHLRGRNISLHSIALEFGDQRPRVVGRDGLVDCAADYGYLAVMRIANAARDAAGKPPTGTPRIMLFLFISTDINRV
ncbi:MAG TPA: hypothetical protein VHM90_19385 [Phycisphaerae bacterium]|nr:hypothetical protein [Phycisphaerae bacterium]